VNLYYEASVAGGIPILRTIANSLASDDITSVLGIVNGTTNYMLTKMMEEGWGYEEALAQAQRLGFAESDPTNDVDGIDAAYKMVILSQFAFGMNVTMDDLKIKGIRGLAAADVEMAAQLGYAVKLIGSSEKTGDSISVEVGPTLVPNTHPLAAVKNEFNAVFVKSTGVGESMYYGPGAGSMPTATSVVADIMVVAKNVAAGVVGQSFNEYTADTKLTPNDQALGKYYFSIEVPDEKGKLLRLIEMMTKAEVDFDKVVQQESDHVKARVVVITHTISKAQMQQVVAAIANEADFELLSTLRVLEA
jgi:homoserine dehydrogenase